MATIVLSPNSAYSEATEINEALAQVTGAVMESLVGLSSFGQLGYDELPDEPLEFVLHPAGDVVVNRMLTRQTIHGPIDLTIRLTGLEDRLTWWKVAEVANVISAFVEESVDRANALLNQQVDFNTEVRILTLTGYVRWQFGNRRTHLQLVRP